MIDFPVFKTKLDAHIASDRRAVSSMFRRNSSVMKIPRRMAESL